MTTMSLVRVIEAARSRDSISFTVLLSAVTVVALGNSVALPFLPEMVHQIMPSADSAARRHHVVALATAFPIAACVSAPLWGWVSDRWRRWPLLLVGLLGFSVTLLLNSGADFEELYVLRLLNGIFAAAVVPTAFAMVADRSPDPIQRARRFTWLNALVFAGDLIGPLVGELSVVLGATSAFFVPAILSAIPLPAILLLRNSVTASYARSPYPPARKALVPLLLISGAATAGLTVLHLTLALGSETRSLSRENVSMLLGLCGAAMLVAQVVPFTGRRVALHAAGFLRPMLAGLAIALVVAVYAKTLWVLIPVFLVAGWSTATLRLLTSYLTSRVSPGAQGSGLALQYAAVSGSQAVASLAVGWSGRSEHLMLWLAAAAALAVMAMTFKERG